MMNEAWDQFCAEVGDALYCGDDGDKDGDGVDKNGETCDDEDIDVTE